MLCISIHLQNRCRVWGLEDMGCLAAAQELIAEVAQSLDVGTSAQVVINERGQAAVQAAEQMLANSARLLREQAATQEFLDAVRLSLFSQRRSCPEPTAYPTEGRRPLGSRSH